MHEGGFRVEGDPKGEIVFRSPHGWALEASPPLGPARARDLVQRNRGAGLRIDSDTCLAGTGERMDGGACLDALVEICDSGH